jgi:hypothetical protein
MTLSFHFLTGLVRTPAQARVTTLLLRPAASWPVVPKGFAGQGVSFRSGLVHVRQTAQE